MPVESSEQTLDAPDMNNHHQVTPRKSVASKSRNSSRANKLDNWLISKMIRMAGHPPFTLQLWDGSVFNDKGSNTHKITLADRSALWLLAYDPEFYFGDLYATGRLALDGDLIEFLELSFHAFPIGNKWNELLHFLRHPPRLNSLVGSKNNIHHHYNIGNDFYSLWLDKEVNQYTCAYFPDPDMTLEQAQIAKLNHIARKLRLQPGQTLVEAGCGWGGLARFMAKNYGVKVKAYNISHEQIKYATQKARDMGLDDRIEYIEDDYRNIKGTYDAFVSVGMLEHVGKKNYKALGHVVENCLREEGLGLIHSIGRNSPGLMNAWTEKRIFPGAYPPSIKEMMNIFEPNHLSILDVENIRLHYSLTLKHWLQRFNENEERVEEMFDADFVRAWRLYLSGATAGFDAAHTQLFQIVFTHEVNNSLPWSRSDIYQNTTTEETGL